jgi:hypothetical protein
MVLHDENQIQLAVRAQAQQGSEGALIIAISSGNALTWTGSTITYERGDFPLTYDFTEILLGSEADFEPMDIDTSADFASDPSDLSMKDVDDENEEDSSSSENSDDGSSDDNDDDIDSFDGTNFDGSDSSDDSGGGALAWKLQATRALQQMDDVISNDNGRGDGYFTAGTGLSTQSVHEGAHAAHTAVLGTQLAAPTTPVDQPMEDFSGPDATAFPPTTTTTTRPDTKQAPEAPASAPQDTTTPTLATPVSVTPYHANPGQAAQLHAEPTSVAPNDIIVNTATATDSNATAAADQSIAAAEMRSLKD